MKLVSKHNQRTEYGKALVELGKSDPRIVVLEADLGKSTMSSLFEQAYPERYFEMGIAEQNMTSFAGGLSLTGKIAFTNTFAVFAAGRAYDQIRQSIATGNLNVKIVGSSAGFSDFGDGATHQAIDDLAIMSAIPNMTVLTPCDGPEVRKALQAAIDTEGPVYLRLCRNDVEDVFPADVPYKVGKPVRLRAGTDLTVFTIGIMAQEALQAASLLEAEGVSLDVVHLPGLKPLDEDAVRTCAAGKKGILICEEHSIRGGATMLISYLLRGSGLPLESVSVPDQFGQSGSSHAELLKHYHVDADEICRKARIMLSKEK